MLTLPVLSSKDKPKYGFISLVLLPCFFKSERISFNEFIGTNIFPSEAIPGVVSPTDKDPIPKISPCLLISGDPAHE